jgi:hypothetical protein
MCDARPQELVNKPENKLECSYSIIIRWYLLFVLYNGLMLDDLNPKHVAKLMKENIELIQGSVFQ